MIEKVKNVFWKLVAPFSKNEDRARSELILNILLLGISGLTFAAFVINLVDSLRGEPLSMPASIIFGILLFFVGLYWMSKKGYSVISTIIFCLLFFTLNSFTAFRYGVDIPSSLLTYALIIIMAGILLGTKAAFVTTLLTVILISIAGGWQIKHFGNIANYWRTDSLRLEDLILFSVIFLIIATVSWLSNREIEKSLIRARRSEQELKEERDSLEIKVEERTREIKEMQMEKMGQLYRFAEFGKLSSGLFHDLSNPLTAASLNMEIVKNNGSTRESEEVRAYVDRALSATRKMEDFVTAVRKQISKQEAKIEFSLNEEVKQVLDILLYKAKQTDVTFDFNAIKEIKTYGDNTKWSQIVLNLVANAIDSYANFVTTHRVVKIDLRAIDGNIQFKVSDHGSGIAKENIEKIFEPFFSTKNGQGMGIGLSLVKRIIEKDFGGTITVTSASGEGTTFIISFPENHDGKNQLRTGN